MGTVVRYFDLLSNYIQMEIVICELRLHMAPKWDTRMYNIVISNNTNAARLPTIQVPNTIAAKLTGCRSESIALQQLTEIGVHVQHSELPLLHSSDPVRDAFVHDQHETKNAIKKKEIVFH